MSGPVDRLFVPLTAQAFGWWRSGRKTHELRADAPRWSERHVYPGRRVELRRGYSGPSLWGRVGEVVRDHLGRMPLHGVVLATVAPEADDWRVAAEAIGLIGRNEALLHQVHADVVAFEVVLDPGQVEGAR